MGDDGKYTGFDVEVAQAVCDLLGWKMEIFALNWDQKLTQLDAKECDCIWAGMTILDSMKEAGYVISEPTMITLRFSSLRPTAATRPQGSCGQDRCGSARHFR